MTSPPAALVTGGTGFLGASLARRLLADSVKVRLLVRSPAKARRLSDLGAEIVAGDIADSRAVREAVDGAQVVYHLAGRLLVPGIPATQYQRTHVEGTRLLLACCRASPGFERLVHCSTTGVLGETGGRPAAETAPMRPTNVYEETKAEAERAVRRAWQDGVPAVIARPGLVYGPGDLHLLPFFRSVLGRRFRPIGRRPVFFHPIFVDDLTEALIRCGRLDQALGECFHLAGRAPVRLSDLAEAIARAGGTRLPRGHIPVAAAKTMGVLGDRLPPHLGSNAPLTSGRVRFLTRSRVYDVGKAERLLGFAASTDVWSGTASAVAWYRHHGYLAPAGA